MMRFSGFRSDRGDGDPVSVIVGSALFVLASAGIVTLLALVLAAGTQAQARTESTLAVQAELDAFATQPYSELVPMAAHTKDLRTGAKTIRAWRAVAAEGNGLFRLTVAVPRAAEASCARALTETVSGCLALSTVRAPSAFDRVPASAAGFVPNVVSAGPSLVVADLDRALLDQASALNLRVAIQARANAPVELWRLAVTCDAANPLPVTADSTPVRAGPGSPWVSARVTVPAPAALASCPDPQLRLWAVGVAPPAPADVQQIRAWRLA